MPSPFPGMNPYLEHPNVWHDFHGAFASELRVVLVEKLRPRYFINVDENVYIHELSSDERRLLGRPDVGIAKIPNSERTPSLSIGLLEAPSEVEHLLAIDELREPYLNIVDAKSREVVTIIELLSPSNKGSDRDLYVSKRNRILRSSSHLVEIDFLRAGRRMADANRQPCSYCITVSQCATRPKAGNWPIQLREPLPTIPIPLSGEEIIRVDLQAILNTVYDRHGFDYQIYYESISPPLPAEDSAWVSSILKTAGISTTA